METIFKKYWPLLEDPHQKNLLPHYPITTYRRATNLKHKIAPSRLKLPPALEHIPMMSLKRDVPVPKDHL